MTSFTRGSTITFEVSNFLTSAGLPATPATVDAHIDYPASCSGRAQTIIALTNSSGTWSGSWDSEGSLAGTVFVSIKAEGSDDWAIDDQFQLTRNRANPNP